METIFLRREQKGRRSNTFKPAFSFEVLQGKGRSYLQNFLVFTENQQHNHLAWLAIAFFGQGCIMSPATVYCITQTGNVFALWIPCLAAFAATEICMLAALPTKITIPVFLGGLILDLIVIAISLLMLF